jgi:hypothetical protein
MARRVSPSQLRSKLRQAESRRRQAVSNYKAAVRNLQRAVDNYNRDARAHNARVRANHRRLQTEIARLNGQRSTNRFSVTRTSTITLHTAYRQVDAVAEAENWTGRNLALVDLAETETINSARVSNALLGEPVEEDELEDTSLTDELSSLSEDLDHRWQGARFALNPRNPDAARHFCTSAGELIIQLIDLKASDEAVIIAKPDCQRHIDGRPARRAKIDYLLERYGAAHPTLAEFLDTDINDVLDLFKVFNDGTHGGSGKFDLATLRTVKVRVEGAVRFLSTLIRGI